MNINWTHLCSFLCSDLHRKWTCLCSLSGETEQCTLNMCVFLQNREWHVHFSPKVNIYMFSFDANLNMKMNIIMFIFMFMWTCKWTLLCSFSCSIYVHMNIKWTLFVYNLCSVDVQMNINWTWILCILCSVDVHMNINWTWFLCILCSFHVHVNIIWTLFFAIAICLMLKWTSLCVWKERILMGSFLGARLGTIWCRADLG